MNDDLPPLPDIKPQMYLPTEVEAMLRAYAAAAVAKEREKAASMLNMTRPQAQLIGGEMSAQEWRTLSAVLAERAAAIRSPD